MEASPNNDSTTPPSPSPTAAEVKERGNAAFKRGEFEASIKHYTEALTLVKEGTEEEYLVLSNRAASYLALERNEEAERDARRVTELAPNFLKGHLRLAMALRAMGRKKEALEAAKRGVQIGETLSLAAGGSTSATPSASGSATSAAPSTVGLPELKRLAVNIHNDVTGVSGNKARATGAVGNNNAAAAPAPTRKLTEQQVELIRTHEELSEEVQMLASQLEERERKIRVLDVTTRYLDGLMMKEGEGEEESEGQATSSSNAPAEIGTYVSVGRMFMKKPASAVMADLESSRSATAKDFEALKSKMASTEQRLTSLAAELKELMV